MSQHIKCRVTDIKTKQGLELLPGFENKCGSKRHTIRAGTDWKVGDRFYPGIWSGKPHVSELIKIAAVIEVKKVWKFECDENGTIKVDGHFIDQEQKEEIAKNDGLSVIDFDEWIVKPCLTAQKPFKGQIICWDDSISYELPKFVGQSSK